MPKFEKEEEINIKTDDFRKLLIFFRTIFEIFESQI